jgi:hypothetical protein
MQLFAAGVAAGQGKEQLGMCMKEQRKYGQHAAGSMRSKRGREEKAEATKKKTTAPANNYSYNDVQNNLWQQVYEINLLLLLSVLNDQILGV